MPIVTVPTDDDNGIGAAAVEGGLVVPFALELSHKWGLGINTGVFAVQDEDASGYHAEYLSLRRCCHTSGRTSSAPTAKWSGWLGVDDPRGDILVLGAGWTYALTDDVQLDGGVNFGLTSAADRYNPFVGLSMRY